MASWCKELTHLKRPWCWERLRAGGEGGDRGWDGWMASPTWWTWISVDSRSWWWTGRLVCYSSRGRKESDMTERLNWTELKETWDIGKEPGAGKDWGQEEKGTTEDEMVGWHHWLNGHEFEQAPGDCEGQGSLLCCSPWYHKESDKTEWLNNNKASWSLKIAFCEKVNSIIQNYFSIHIIWKL